MKKLKLSICIPTYNRAGFLEIQLNKILLQIRKDNLENCLEVVISDNASTDLTSIVVQEFMKAFSQVNYIIQAENIGLYNIVEVAKYAKGKFVWIVSDDDLVVDGAIKYLIETITANDDLKMITGSVVNQKTFYNLVTTDKNMSLRILGNNIAYLSFCVFKNDEIRFEMPKDSLIPHAYIFLDVMSKSGEHVFSPVRLLEYRRNNETSYSFFKAFYSDMYQLYLYALQTNYDKIYLDKMISMLTIGILGRLDVIQNSKVKIGQVDLVSHFKIDKIEAREILRNSFPNQFHLEKKVIEYSLNSTRFLYAMMALLNFGFASRRYLISLKRSKKA